MLVDILIVFVHCSIYYICSVSFKILLAEGKYTGEPLTPLGFANIEAYEKERMYQFFYHPDHLAAQDSSPTLKVR